jgi:DNA primase
MFPIRDVSGRVIAFGGRAMSDDKGPKYLNSPETPLFQKGQTLWGLDRARQAMGDVGRAIVVEGYLDAIACHEAGMREAVATMGTALTAEHVELLRRRAGRLVLAFDSDSAGLAAALRGRELFERAGVEVLVVTLPEGMDPDDVIRKRGGEAFGELVEGAAPMLEWELRRVLGPAEGKREREWMEGLRAAVGVLARVPAGVEREHYVRWLAERWARGEPGRLGNAESAVRDELRRQTARRGGQPGRRDSAQSGAGAAAEPSAGGRVSGDLREMVLAAFIEYGELAARHASALTGDDFPDETQRKIFEGIQALVGREAEVSAKGLMAEVGADARGLLAGLALRGVPEERVEESVERGVQRLIEARLRQQRQGLLERLSQVATEEEKDAIRRELTEVARRRSELAGQRIVGEE